jgi:hypothetical protein
MIGLSVPFCIRDLVEDRVSPAVVEKIIGSTEAETPDEINELVRQFRAVYWYANPGACERLFRSLLSEGKIEQPRITTGRTPLIANGHWVASEDDITWG